MGYQLKLVMAGLLMLTLAGCTALTGKTAGRNVDDASITGRVKTALVMDKASNLTRVDVDTNRGVVYLNGVVDSQQQKARAQDLASRVGGVEKVVNNLQVAHR
jgi:hyperosmotically inducible protein